MAARAQEPGETAERLHHAGARIAADERDAWKADGHATVPVRRFARGAALATRSVD
jgi:hypothetical protein